MKTHLLLIIFYFSITLTGNSQIPSLINVTTELPENPDPNKIHVVLLSDGYIASEQSVFFNAANFQSSSDVREILSPLQNRSPYKEYLNYFEFYVIFQASEVGGVKHPGGLSTFKARYANLDPSEEHAFTSKDSTINAIGTNEYWMLERTYGSANVSVTLYRDNMGCSYDTLDNLKITAFNGSTWKDLGQGSSTGNDSTGTISTSGVSSIYGMYTLATSDTFDCVPCRADAGEDLYIHPNAELIIGNNNPVLGNEYYWSPNEHVYQNGKPYAFVHTPENREFKLQVINSKGCNAVDSAWVTFFTNLWIPVHNHNCVSP